MESRARAAAIALLSAAVAAGTMLALFRGDSSDYLLTLALFAVAVFLVVFRWQTVQWMEGRRWAIARRTVGIVAVSWVAAMLICTAALVGAARLSGCPLMGDPIVEIELANHDNVALVVYPEGPLVPNSRREIAPGDRLGWSYPVGCESEEKNRLVWTTITAEHAGVWVYCREVTRGELVMRDFAIELRRGELGCVPEGLPAGAP